MNNLALWSPENTVKTIEANNYNRAARWLESPSLRLACPSFQNSSFWAIVPLNGEP